VSEPTEQGHISDRRYATSSRLSNSSRTVFIPVNKNVAPPCYINILDESISYNAPSQSALGPPEFISAQRARSTSYPEAMEIISLVVSQEKKHSILKFFLSFTICIYSLSAHACAIYMAVLRNKDYYAFIIRTSNYQIRP
jgi:hypothetical protein